MCVVSMVSNHYSERWPFLGGLAPQAIPNSLPGLQQASELAELRQIIQEFREAMAAAKRVDELTAQPDCEDAGKKLALEARVSELERRLNELDVVTPLRGKLGRAMREKIRPKQGK